MASGVSRVWTVYAARPWNSDEGVVSPASWWPSCFLSSAPEHLPHVSSLGAKVLPQRFDFSPQRLDLAFEVASMFLRRFGLHAARPTDEG